ncbi:uncharacterized protein DUF3168 [Aneurinibacillus soli]|uniref:Uncharacterized protein n=1 Tax=Aneurinibacillus soli TaxID=1500254 RepID=A0A0U5B064_9BACL|nr:DUF3168 domain-containing protein [Aneurinibacillus soli]PYE63436.1 uncharacterized protein DUF3168 [Aneurinibacillus soli]BAU27632.1 hypothetical protein CB4_01806 [Aneurinibacillus soli]
MINLKPKIVQALESNQVLVSLLGGKRIYPLKAPRPNEFPRITFFELNNADDQYADDAAISSEIRVQIDVWAKTPSSEVSQEVARTMKELGFQRYSAQDLYEEDTEIFHKGMRYKTTVVHEEE